MLLYFWMQHIEKEWENRSKSEKRCNEESWRESHLRIIWSKCKKEYMRFVERSFNMKTKIWEVSNEFSLAKTRYDKNDMRDFWISQLKSCLLLRKKSNSLLSIQLHQQNEFLKTNFSLRNYLMLETNQLNIKTRILS